MEPTRDARTALARLRAAAADGTLTSVATRHDVQLLVVFGSAVDGSAAPQDLDLAVGHRGELDVLALAEDLYALIGYEGLDLMDLRRAGTVARGESLGHGRLLWESADGLFAEAQMIALATMWDTRWLRDLELAQLARGGRR